MAPASARRPMDTRIAIFTSILFTMAAAGCSDDGAADPDAGAAVDAARDGGGEVGPSDGSGSDARADAVPCKAAGTYTDAVTLGSTTHGYTVHIPAGAASAAPLIVLLHGGGSSGAAMDKVSGLSKLGATEKFIVVTPEGWKGAGVPVWNAGACCGPGQGAPDHVAAITAILDRMLATGVCYDKKRVYATGHSNGAMMSYRLACERSDRFAAVAISAGTLTNQDFTVTPAKTVFPCKPPRSVPILHVHGLADLCVPYAGGKSTATGNTTLAVEQVISMWRTLNGCGSGTDKTTGEVRRRVWSSCSEGAAVELITVKSLGHAWAGSTIYGNPKLCGGATTTQVSTTQELWKFFKQHKLP